MPCSLRWIFAASFAGFGLGCLGNSVDAQDAITPDVLQRLKQATVFVKVAVGQLNWSGSGFVIHGDDEAVYLVTNAHVVTKPNIGSVVPLPFGLRGRDLLDLRRIQADIQNLDVQVTAVFHSGTPQEAALSATVVALDAQRDLAVVRVAGLKARPTPVPIDPQFHPVETTPVFTFGFPFGEALSQSKGNPAMTVGRGTVSSIRLDDEGVESAVQIDGALNPGNSGGPVVDVRGRLVGVAVATIKGSGIGFAVPPSALETLLSGGVADVRVSSRTEADGTRFDIELSLFDPYRKIAQVKVHCASRAMKTDAAPQQQPLESSELVDLECVEQRARGVWRLSMKSPQPAVVSFQPAIVDRAGRTTYMAIKQHPLVSATPVAPRTASIQPKTPTVPRGAPPADRKVLRGAPQKIGELTLSEGIVILGRRTPVMGLGLSEPTARQPAITYFVVYRLPAGEIQRTSAVASVKRTGEQALLSYTAFLDDEELKVEHAVTPAGREIAQARLLFQQQSFDPANGRTFLIDLRQEPPRIVQKKAALPEFPMTEALDDARLVEYADRALAELQKADSEVAAFVAGSNQP